MILLTSHALTQLDRAGATSSSKLTGQSAGKAHCFLQQLLAPCESEYVALTAAAQEASYLRNLQIQMQGTSIPAAPICIYIDSQPVLDLVNNHVYHSRSKHIQARYHSVRDKVFVEKEIEVEKIPLGHMGAKMMTKHACVGVIRYNKKLVGMM